MVYFIWKANRIKKTFYLLFACRKTPKIRLFVAFLLIIDKGACSPVWSELPTRNWVSGVEWDKRGHNSGMTLVNRKAGTGVRTREPKPMEKRLRRNLTFFLTPFWADSPLNRWVRGPLGKRKFSYVKRFELNEWFRSIEREPLTVRDVRNDLTVR